MELLFYQTPCCFPPWHPWNLATANFWGGRGWFYISEVIIYCLRYGSLVRLIKDGFHWQNWHCLMTRVIRFVPFHGHQILAGMANGVGHEWNNVGYNRPRWNGTIMAV